VQTLTLDSCGISSLRLTAFNLNAPPCSDTNGVFILKGNARRLPNDPIPRAVSSAPFRWIR